MKYFFIKQKNGRKDVWRVFRTSSCRCEFIQGYPSEDAAKASVRQLIEEDGL